MNVAEYRYIQSLHETGELQNPDRLVGQFLPLLRRWRCRRLSLSKVLLLRTNPFTITSRREHDITTRYSSTRLQTMCNSSSMLDAALIHVPIALSMS